MSELKYSAVNVDAKALEEQNENLKKPKNDFQNSKKLSFEKITMKLKIILILFQLTMYCTI